MNRMNLPGDFLNAMAVEHCLSRREAPVLLLRFEQGLEYDSISRQLKITKPATLKRMGQIYRKFGIDGKVKGKDVQLTQYLNQRHREFLNEGLHTRENLGTFRENLSTQSERKLRGAFRELAELESEIYRLKEKNQQLESVQQILDMTQEWHEPIELCNHLLVDLIENGYSSQMVLRKLAVELPKLIERKAAESDKYSEREITHALLRCAIKFFLGLEMGLPERYITQSNKPDDNVDTVSL